jgi:membrane-associated phospholipid phosphatase
MQQKFRVFLLPLLLLAAAIVALGVDLPVAMTFKQWNHPSASLHGIDRTIHAYLGYFDVFEPFGHGFGVVVVLIVLHQLDRTRRWAMPRLIAAALAAGGAADLVKMLIMRTRPNDVPADFTGSVWATFGHWLPGLSAASSLQSFPSAHTATAAGFAAALVWLYPQGRLLFTALAALVGCQRIISGAHFPSDVLTGAAVGCAASMFVLRVGPLPALFDGVERRWRGSGRFN